MDIRPVQNEPIPGNTYRIAPADKQEGNGRKTVQETGELSARDSPVQNHSKWSELQKINDSLNEVAKKNRTDDKIISRVEDYVDRMKAELERILKNFPPFPPGSEDRINLLRGYVGFRKLIDELTIPRPKESAVVVETSKVLSPADSVPGASQPDEISPGDLQA